MKRKRRRRRRRRRRSKRKVSRRIKKIIKKKYILGHTLMWCSGSLEGVYISGQEEGGSPAAKKLLALARGVPAQQYAGRTRRRTSHG